VEDCDRLIACLRRVAIVEQNKSGFANEAEMINARLILTTIGSKDRAERLAQQLVERRLAACVNIVGPIRSVYRWKQKIEHEEEYLLLIKTMAAQTAQLRAAIRELHPYELPECMELAIDGGSEEYLAWLAEEVGGQ
jgi:periplasmic divalent cation tolerance protein